MKRFAALLVTGLIAGALAPLADVVDAGKPPRLRWRTCHEDAGLSFECATVKVPLDHDRPRGRKTSLALVRLPATDPEHKLGSIFLNPGGPGGSGVDFVLAIGSELFSDEVRARFDLIGFDPRGVAASDPLLCFRSFDEALSMFAPFAFPLTPSEEQLVEELDGQLNDACQRRGGRIVDHMATADVARDLDLLRRAVGDRTLNFVGYSYGSFLGVTYANLFPRRVGAVVVDGVLDPIAWTTGRGDEAATLPFSTRLRSDAGAQATLDEFLRLCDEAGPEGCAFAGDATARYAALAERLRAAPVELVDPDTGETFLVTYQDLIGESLGALYDSFSWPDFAGALAEVEAAAATPAVSRLDASPNEATAGGHRGREIYPNFVESFPGVACSDSVNPEDHDAWSRAGADADVEFGYFGRIWTWASSPCAVWEGFDDDRYVGPFNRSTANPVLVVGTQFDPATRYEGAVIVDQLLPNSSLLTIEGWGHTSIFLSSCADDIVSEYLLEGDTPDPGTSCAQDIGPFETHIARSGDLAERQQARAEALEHIANVPGR